MRDLPLQSYLQIISGADRSWRARLLRTGLRLGEPFYACAMLVRNKAYDWGWLPVHRVDVPVISVGNLTLGGTGKTPFVAWLARWYRRKNLRVAIISRGYGAHEGNRNDEAKVLEMALPDVPHLQNPDRVLAARTAITELETELIVLDDAFQHRRLARDLDIVLIDALEPFGYGHVFPRGLLREPISGIRRAGIVVLSRADLVSDAQREKLRRHIREIHPAAIWAEIAQRPTVWVNAAQQTAPQESLNCDRAAAFCGIGNPEAFRQTLGRLGISLVGFRTFPDHHAYTRQDIADLSSWIGRLQARVALCTEKDLVKIGLTHLGGVPLWALRVEVAFLEGLPAVESRLEELASVALRRRGQAVPTAHDTGG